MSEYSFTAALLTSNGRTHIAPVESMTVTADNGWAPRYTAQVVVLMTPRLINTPPTMGRIVIERHPGVPVTLADWTKQWGGDMAAYTAAGATSTAAITAATGGNPDTNGDEPQRLDLIMTVRDIVPNVDEGTATVTLSSIEMDLQEYVRVWPNPRTWPASTKLPEVVLDVLASVGMTGVNLTAWEADYVIGDAAWTPGQSCWDFLNTIIEPFDLRLWSDSPTVWTLARALDIYSRTPMPRTIDYTNITPRYEPTKRRAEAGITITTDSKTGGRNVTVVGQQGTKRGTVTEYTVDQNLPPGTTYTYIAGTIPIKPVLAGAELTAVADLTVRADQSIFATQYYHADPNLEPVDVDGRVLSVSWEYPEGLMTVRSETIPVDPGTAPPIDPPWAP